MTYDQAKKLSRIVERVFGEDYTCNNEAELLDFLVALSVMGA
jgi:hypothetical protein